MSSAELENKITVLLGGRAAESMIFPSVSTGAADDLGKATEIARSMVVHFGMTKELGQVAYEAEVSPFLAGPAMVNWQPRRYSEETAGKIDRALKEIVEQAFERAVAILKRNRGLLEASAKDLLKRETLGTTDLERLGAKIEHDKTGRLEIVASQPRPTA